MSTVEREVVCNVCHDGKAVYYRVYSGERLCRTCFVKTFEKRVIRTIGRYKLFKPDDKIAVAVSGGKDSLSLLYVLKKIERRFPRAGLLAVTVDEGIEGYRDEALEYVEEVTRMLEVPLYKTSFEEVFGKTLSEIVASRQFRLSGLAACSVCGPLRRRAINIAAKRAGATVIATAHTLDDVVQTYFLKTFRGELGTSEIGLRLEGPFIPRVAPFRLTPEREVVFYAYLHNIPFQSQVCPNAADSMRNMIRRFLAEFDERYPGSLFAALRSFEKTTTLGKKIQMVCSSCGEPSSRELCRVCELTQTLIH
ncbi:MAG: TIGR00269 family protein [Aigarchaeota archaeon]|nr:TIGR00269 family protein [Candidatus Caldarchaeales archaeon]MDJ0273555.1 TIGR00269 family protein [Candidatus Caldarchaeales archaeon]